MLVEAAFWMCLLLLLYIYAGYPVVASVLAKAIDRRVEKKDIEPTVTVVISAFNEESVIRESVLNKLSQDYPASLLDVIVVSDGSTDGTNDVLRELAASARGRVRFLIQEPRQGKTQALNLAIRNISSEIVVFSDANSIYPPDTVRALVRNFADPFVGYVTGQMVYKNSGNGAFAEGSSSYMSYENMLRAVETKLGSVVGVDGGVDAVRRELYVPMSADQLPDFVLPLNVIEQDRRVVYESQALLYEQSLCDSRDEFRMRVRVSLRALWALYDKRSLLNPLRYPLFAWQLLSHKVLRYLAFLPLMGVVVFNALAIERHLFYLWFFVLLVLFAVIVLAGHVLRKASARRSGLLVPYYFVVLNAACLLAFWKFMNNEKMILWKPRAGA